MYRNKGTIIRKLAVIMLAFVVTVTFTPLLGDGSYAASAKSGKKYDEKVKYIQKDANGKEKELDPEIFTDKGKVLNADELEDLGIGVEPGSSGKEPTPVADDANDLGKTEVTGDTVIEDEANLSAAAVSAEGVSLKNLLSSESMRAIENRASEMDAKTSDDEAEAATENAVADEEKAEEETASTIAGKPAVGPEESLTLQTEDVSTADAKPSPSIGVTVNPSTGQASLSGTIAKNGTDAPHYYFGWIQVDGNDVLWSGDYCKSINGKTINMKNYSYGYHYIRVQVYGIKADKTIGERWYITKYNVPAYMYATPTSPGSFAVYSTYMDYMPTNFMSGGLAIRMQYSADGVNWAETGYMPNYYQTYTIGGLAPSTTYQTRIYFYQTNPIGGHYFNGAETGSFLYTGTYTTGRASLPKVKNVKVKATKVKKRKAGVYGWYTGYYFGSVKYYTYKIKVTVQFKKKPGLNGLYINGAWKPGNKKKYTLTLGPYANYSKPRGKKFNVYLYSAVAPGGYGGYSPMVSKTKKVK